MKLLELIIAQATHPTSAGDDTNAPWWAKMLNNPIALMVGVVLIISMFMGKGRKGEEKARTEMLKQLKGGDRIQTIGGIQGAVTKVEEARVQVKVDEASNTKMWFARTAIARVIDTEKSEKSDSK